MAYLSKDLSVLAYANGFTLWGYITTDTNEVVNAPGYFNPSVDMVRSGDIIIANTSMGDGDIPSASLIFITHAKDETVTTVNMIPPAPAG